MGRPGLAPGVYFRLLLVGYFEGIDSERGIAWRAGDSLSIREFVGIPLNEGAPDHTTISRTRRLSPRVFEGTTSLSRQTPRRCCARRRR